MRIALGIVIAYSIFHLLIILQVIPYAWVWGGKIESILVMYVLEGVATIIMLFLGLVIALKNKLVSPIFKEKTINKILWVFAVFFILNTLGNLLAETVVEKCQAIITLYLAIILYKASKQIEYS